MKRRAALTYLGFGAVGIAIAEPLLCRIPGLFHSAVYLDKGGATFNQVGFLPANEKVATVLAASTGDDSFQLYSERKKKTVFHGRLSNAIDDAASGDTVAVADFSAWTKPGIYRIVVQGKRSEPFSISEHVYRDPLRLAMRAFYGQRCGCAVDLGNGYKHPPCHAANAFHPSSGREGALANHGGWHDAGDYGRYVVNSGITTGTLLWAWELYPEALRALSLDHPESKANAVSGLPDYLAEIKWNLQWMLSMQDDDGGVWHKQTSEQFCAFIMPEQDNLTSYVIGTGADPFKSTCATADLAAVMAIAARCYAPCDAAFSARCLAAAERAWIWATDHPSVAFKNPPGVGTGGYDDPHCDDELLWASAELWRTTSGARYEESFLGGVGALPPETAIHAPNWGSVAPLAYWTYALAESKDSAHAGSADGKSTARSELRARILSQTLTEAETLIARRKSSGYGNTLDLKDYGWGSNSDAANQSLLLLIAHHLKPDDRTVEAALGNLHYLLGRNCFGVSWVTQVGTNPFQHPHHRPSAADGIAAPWPGLLSGGPNRHPGDAAASSLPALPPMRMWLDDERAYSLNEIAINWNAPLVFLLAGANAHALKAHGTSADAAHSIGWPGSSTASSEGQPYCALADAGWA